MGGLIKIVGIPTIVGKHAGLALSQNSTKKNDDFINYISPTY